MHISPTAEWRHQPQLGVEERVKTVEETTKGSVEEQKSTEESVKSSEKILRLIQNNPSITAREVAERMGLSSRNVEKHIRNLRTKNLLRRIGPTKGGHWEVVD